MEPHISNAKFFLSVQQSNQDSQNCNQSHMKLFKETLFAT